MAAEVLCILDKTLARAEIVPFFKMKIPASFWNILPVPRWRGCHDSDGGGILAQDNHHRRFVLSR